MPDFEVYWKAGVRAQQAEPLYREQDEHYRLKYLPGFAILAIPAGLLPLEVAKSAWFAASVASVAALLTFSLKLLPERRRAGWVLIATTVVVMGKFYGHELVLGQVNLLLGATIAAAAVAMRSGREALAGTLIAIAVLVKPYALLFVPWLAARKRLPSLVAVSAGVTVAVLLPLPVYGTAGTVALHLDWWQTVSESTTPNLLNPDNVSIAAMYAKWVGIGPIATLVTAVTSVLLVAFVSMAYLRRRAVEFPEGLETALLATTMPLLSPQGWDYVFLVATPAVMFLVNYSDRLPRPWWIAIAVALATIGLSVFDLMGRANYRTFMAWSVLSVCFFVVIAALGTLRIRRIA